MAVNAWEVLPYVKSGKLKVLAVWGAARSAIFPDVPTIAESGFAGFEASVWYGLVAPAATPKPIIAKLHAEQLGALIHSERLRYEKLVREAGIKPD